MGCCAGTTAGSRKRLPEVSWHCGLSCHGLEVEGILLDRYLDHFTGLNLHEQHEVIGRVVQEADQSPSSSAGVCSRKVARVGLLSWNVGGISDHRKDQGAGLEEAAQAAVADVLHAAVAKIGAADIIVVGLQEIISLTPSNAMKGTSSFNESRKNQSFYGWPETVAQWVEVLLGGLNSGPMPSGPAGKSFCSDHRSYVLYGQLVYLFGLLLCVFCPAYLLKHIRDFGMAEKPMDSRIKSGAKGAVACRFVLWDRSFCFLNCHLAATTSNSARISARDLRQRLRQLEQCWTEIKFKSHVNQMVYPVSAHRAIFLLGDTNMRLVHKSDINEDFGSYATKTISAKENGYRQLWSLDQLCQELGPEPQPSLREHKIRGLGLNVTDEQFLSQWQEPFVSGRQGPPFPPTFKLAVPGPGYSKKRVPAWTDRVLYSSDHAEPLKYGSLQQSQVLSPPHNVSDHDPVYAFFDVECMGIDPRRLGLLARQVRGESRETRRLSSRLTTSGRMQSQVLQAQALEEDALAPQTEIDDASRKLFEQVTTLQDSSETALACLMLQECQQECWKLLCSQLEQKLGCSIRHIQTSQSTGGHEMADEEAEEVVRKLDSEALQEGLREVLQSMQRGDDWQCNRVLSGAAQTLLERRSHGLLRKKSSDNSLLSL